MFPRFVKFKEGAKLTYDRLRLILISWLLWLCTHVWPSSFSGPPVEREQEGVPGAWSRAQISFPFPFEGLPRMLCYSYPLRLVFGSGVTQSSLTWGRNSWRSPNEWLSIWLLMEVWPYGWFQKKKYPASRFQRKRFLARKFLHWKKNLSWCIILEKKSYTCVCQGKKFYHQRFGKQIITQSKSLIVPFLPALKSQMVRTFLSARSAHNVFIVMSLPA